MTTQFHSGLRNRVFWSDPDPEVENTRIRRFFFFYTRIQDLVQDPKSNLSFILKIRYHKGIQTQIYFFSIILMNDLYYLDWSFFLESLIRILIRVICIRIRDPGFMGIRY